MFWNPYGADDCSCPQATAERNAKTATKHEQFAKARKAELIEKLRRYSGGNLRIELQSFDNFDPRQNPKALAAAQEYAAGFSDRRSGEDCGKGLFLVGVRGVGKSHLAAAITNAVIGQGVGVIFTTAYDLLARIKATYSTQDIDEGAVLNVYRTIPLLVIDDPGKEQPTEWSLSRLYSIIDYRYRNLLPVIITSNYGDKELVERLTPQYGDRQTALALVDRLFEMCLAVPMGGQSWRSGGDG